MFINCPHCRSLVATDPVTDQPPERCPRCSVALREPVTWSSLDVADAVTANDGEEMSTAQTEARVSANDARSASDTRTPASSLDVPSPAPTPTELAAYVEAMNAQPAPSHGGSLASWLKPPVVTEVTYTRDADAAPAGARAAMPTRSGDAIASDPPESVVGIDARDAAGSRAPATPRDDSENDDRVASPADVPADNGPSSLRSSLSTRPASDATSTGDGIDSDTDSVVAAAASTALPTSSGTGQSLVPPRPAPSFASASRARGPAPGAPGWTIPTAIATLVVLLSLQLVLADRASLAADARWRPAVLALCGVFRCTVPAWHEPDAFMLLDRNVQPDATTPGVLRVTATFRNDARWPQPWPRMRLTLSDIDGNAVAAREFAPRDYLGAMPAQAEVATGQSASVAMDVLEPGARSVAFDFQLH